MFARDRWYVAALTAELTEKPLARRYLGEPVVCFARQLGAEGEDESSLNWRYLRFSIMPNLFVPVSHGEWTVPIDDSNALSVVWQFTPVPIEQEPCVQDKSPYWWGVTKDDEGDLIASHVLNQDFVAWAGQGEAADRRAEDVGRSDRGVQMLRQIFKKDMRAVAEG